MYFFFCYCNADIFTVFQIDFSSFIHSCIHSFIHSFSQSVSQSVKNWREFRFVDRVNKAKVTTLMCLSNIPSKQQHFHITSGKLVYCFRGEFNRTKLIL